MDVLDLTFILIQFFFCSFNLFNVLKHLSKHFDILRLDLLFQERRNIRVTSETSPGPFFGNIKGHV